MGTHQFMVDLLVLDIFIQASTLDDVRRAIFLEWLKAHHSNVNPAEVEVCWKTNLKAWFESLTVIGMFWEYHLILSEVIWWRDLDQGSLNKILEEVETVQR